MAKNEKEAKAPKAPKAPKVKDPVKEAQREKRRTALKELAKTEPLEFHHKIGFKEARILKVVGVDGKPIEGWKQFCESKLRWETEFWTKAMEKSTMSDKSLTRKKAAFLKLKERLAKYEAELAGLLETEK